MTDPSMWPTFYSVANLPGNFGKPVRLRELVGPVAVQQSSYKTCSKFCQPCHQHCRPSKISTSRGVPQRGREKTPTEQYRDLLDRKRSVSTKRVSRTAKTPMTHAATRDLNNTILSVNTTRPSTPLREYKTQDYSYYSSIKSRVAPSDKSMFDLSRISPIKSMPSQSYW